MMLEVYLNQDFSYDTRKTYKSVLTRFLGYLEKKNIPVEKINPDVFMSYARRYKDTTQNKIISIIKTYYKWLTRTELAIDGMTPQSYRPDRNLPVEDVKRMIRNCTNYRDRLLMRTLFLTGIRVAEVASITKENITIDKGQFWLSFTAKGGKQRKIKLQSGLAQELLKFNSDKETIFGIGRRHVERIIASLSQEILGRTVTPHCFRHGFATELMKQGVSFQRIQEELGHEDIKTTLKYLHNKRGNDQWFIDL